MNNRFISFYLLATSLFAMPVWAVEERNDDVTVEQAKKDRTNEHRNHRERWQKMSDEDREAFKAKRREIREKMSSMTPEERRAFREQLMEERLAKMTPEQRQRFEKHHAKRMKRFDTDGDGQISDDEKRAARNAWKAKRLERFDTDGDGKVSDEEKLAARNAWKAKRLERFDTDGDGQISDDERDAIKQERNLRRDKYPKHGASDGDRS